MIVTDFPVSAPFAADADAAPTVDQRSLPRDATPDVGSFEVQAG